MRVPLLFSVSFHVAIFLFAIFGLPQRDVDVVENYRVIDAEIVSVTQTPEPKPLPKEKEEVAKAEPKPPAPPPPPPPQEQVAALPPDPKPEPQAKPEPPPEAVPIPVPKPVEAPPKPKPVEEPPKQKVEEKAKPSNAPRPKPKPRPDFNTMMLKTVEKLKEPPQPKEDPKEKEKDQKKSFEEQMAALMQKQTPPQEKAQRAPLGDSLSISEIDALRRHMEKCWSVPTAIGAKNVETMVVEIGMKLNPDATVRSARITDQFRYETDSTFRAVAESALRAVRNPRCQPFPVPLDKYDQWKDMVMAFDPRDMVGR